MPRGYLDVVLLGGGGHASDVLALIDAMNMVGVGPRSSEIRVVGILADSDVDPRRFVNRGVRHLGSIDDIRSIDAAHYHVCIGYPQGRRAVVEQVSSAGLQSLTLVHPRAWVHNDAVIGGGTAILAGACVSPGVKLGEHVLIHQGSIVGHDCCVGDFVSIMPGAVISGDTILGAGSLIGANATVLEKRKVGANAIVGAAALVTSDVPNNLTAKGVPARFP